MFYLAHYSRVELMIILSIHVYTKITWRSYSETIDLAETYFKGFRVSFHAQTNSQSFVRSPVDLWASRELASAPN